MKDPLVSVLMTSYNREKYISIAIESVLASTFTDFELIIVDDKSIDQTVSIAKSFERKDSRIKVYENKINLGDYPNRNQAAAYANGKYLKYVDADDLIYPWGLELLVKMMEQFPVAGWGLCSLLPDERNPFPFQLQPSDAYKYHYLGRGLFHKAPLSAIIKRDAFIKVGQFNSIRMAGDFDMWNRLAQKFPVVLMPDGIVWYRKHSQQEINIYEKYEMVYERLKIKYLKDQNCPLTQEEIKAVFRSTIKKNLRLLPKAILRWGEFGKIINRNAFWISRRIK